MSLKEQVAALAAQAEKLTDKAVEQRDRVNAGKLQMARRDLARVAAMLEGVEL